MASLFSSSFLRQVQRFRGCSCPFPLLLECIWLLSIGIEHLMYQSWWNALLRRVLSATMTESYSFHNQDYEWLSLQLHHFLVSQQTFVAEIPWQSPGWTLEYSVSFKNIEFLCLGQLSANSPSMKTLLVIDSAGFVGSWKTWKVMEFYNFIFQAWKVMEFRCGSRKMMFIKKYKINWGFFLRRK